MDYKIEGLFIAETTIDDFVDGINSYSDLVKKMIWDEVVSSFDRMDSVLSEIKSPIEQALYLAIQNGYCLTKLNRCAESVYFDYQHKVKLGNKNYILDFLLAVLIPDHDYFKFAIECDGHDFHEKTKKQAASDRQRERTLIANGYTVIRFTGSEIFNDPYKCADEIANLIISQMKPYYDNQVGE